VLALTYPIALSLLLRLHAVQPVPLGRVITQTTLISIVVYIVSWSPVAVMVYTMAVPGTLALILTASLRRMSLGKLFALWIYQGIVVTAIGTLTFFVVEGSRPFVELPSIVAYAREHDVGPNSKPRDLGRATPPDAWEIEWQTTKSAWLDENGNEVTFLFSGDQPGLTVSLRELAGDVVHMGTEPPYTFTTRVRPDVPYRLRLAGPSDIAVNVQLVSVLTPDSIDFQAGS
jgi:hypothetical protein